jgi:hypothetical protein
MSKFVSAVIFSGSVLMGTSAFGITLGQVDDFNDGTLQSWVSGFPNPVPPLNINDVGQLGVGDHVMQVRSNGALGGAGSLPVVFNNAQWIGDYLAAGVTSITLDINNLSAVDINPGLEIRGSLGQLFTFDGPLVPALSGWQSITIDVTPSNLVGANVLAILAGVNELRFRNIISGLSIAPAAATIAYYDNITATGDLDGDLDGDGFVGITDLNIVLGDWNLNVPPANPLADPSGDNFVGIEDLNTVLGNWNAGTPPAAAAVPEPASMVLLGLGASVLLRRRG